MGLIEAAVKHYKQAVDTVSRELDADVLMLNGKIEHPVDRQVIGLCRARHRRQNVVVILVTNGGDADVAYRISRCLQRSYKKFILYVTGQCKSAGTIIALGAHELIISDYGELGPLDVQLRKADELWEMSSGLTVLKALSTLQDRSFSMFESCFLDLKRNSGGQITLKTATEIATNFTTGLFGRIYGQIEPLRLGEISRAMTIGIDYGTRLSAVGRNVKNDALNRLTADYSSHSFVIDRQEASELFNNVRVPTQEEFRLAELLGESAITQLTESAIHFLSEPHITNMTEATNDTAKDCSGTRGSTEEARQETVSVAAPSGSEQSNGASETSSSRS